MTNELIWVRYKNMSLSMPERVAKELGLKPNQRVSFELMQKIIPCIASDFADELDQRRAAGESNIPDPSQLRKMLYGH